MITRKTRKQTIAKLASILGITLFPYLQANSESHAATVTWDNNGPTNNWSTAPTHTNWLPGNTLWVNGDSAIFGDTPETVTVTTANTVQDITFQGSWTIAGGVGSLSTVASTQSVITVDPTFTATITETIGGTGGVTKEGTGTLVLQAANSGYTGPTIVNAGTLQANGDRAISASSAVTVNSGGTLRITSVRGINAGGSFTVNDGGTVFINNNATNVRLDMASVTMTGGSLTGAPNGNTFAGLAGNGIAGLTFNINANATPSIIDTVRLQGNPASAAAATLTFNTAAGAQVNVASRIYNGANSGASSVTSLTKTGTGTLLLSQSNSYTGTTTISAGTILAGGSSQSSFTTVIFYPSVTGNAETDAFTYNGNHFVDGDAVVFSTGSGSPSFAGGISGETIYYVVNKTASDFQVSLTPGGTPIDLTTAGASQFVSRAGGVFGGANSALVLGDGATTAGDAPTLLIDGAYTIARPITVGSVANTAAYNATIGGSNTTDISTFTGNITLNATAANYTTTLQAATGGTVEFSTGTWTTNDKAINIGAPGNTGTVKLSNALSTTGGVFVTAGTLQLGVDNALSSATPVTVSGGTWDLAAFNDSVSAVTLQSGAITGTGILTSGAAFDVQAGSVNVVLDGTAGLVKNTAGIVTLSGANTYTGTTTINAGTLALNGAGTISDTLSMVDGSTVDLTAKSGALSLANLLGAGSIVGGNTVSVSTALTPGSSPGTLSIANNLDLASTTLLTWELSAGNQTVGSGINDLVAVTGNLTLDGTLDVNGIGSFAGVTSGTWTLLTYSGALTDNGLVLNNLPMLDPSYQWSLNTGSGTNSAVTLSITAIPEPSTFAFLISGAAIVLGLGRRLRREKL